MAKLLVRATLTNFDEPAKLQPSNYFSRFENRDGTHGAMSPRPRLALGTEKLLADSNCFGTDELRFKSRLAIFEQHLHDLRKIFTKLIRRFRLGVSAGKSRDVADIISGRVIALEDSLECANGVLLLDYKEIYAARRTRYGAATI